MFKLFIEARELELCLRVGTCWHEWDLGPHVILPQDIQ